MLSCHPANLESIAAASLRLQFRRGVSSAPRGTVGRRRRRRRLLGLTQLVRHRGHLLLLSGDDLLPLDQLRAVGRERMSQVTTPGYTER